MYDSTSPGLLAEIYEKRVIEVPNSIKKPVFMKQEGIRKGVYLGVGTSTRRAIEEYIAELMRENKRINFDGEAIIADPKLLAKQELKEVFGTSDNRRLLAEKIICQSAADAKQFYPTVIGVLSFSEQPEQYISESFTICSAFKGDSGREIIGTDDKR